MAWKQQDEWGWSEHDSVGDDQRDVPSAIGYKTGE
ncbi:uncharacterized protein Nmag_3050 [Natrialba magadii ATCC 43099]|uniref:Uncharacterized protein n=1 Tax=Natrialba magadii (strain ATCC 43099 / DSM 3394 / CCM 3739 / CIP 104546 / IAM 13178 / JCM 8861 / NBRC 102185 / NCIMB 2190 / MS3) TaxID=547559 RepID=D3SR46_NATMM|nr:uncharacterized protein Nmag_3050 [Natrialba magadii ATCC 43099]ELY31936.1 hypothetical protein C500_05143 [Natrialba magadii ATCC 43099]